MLKNLLKYDLKWVYKGLVIFYLLSFTFAILTRALSLVDSTIIIIIGKICAGITISMLINILINNSMRNWARFITNFYKDEAYLTHTLPVTKKKLYLSKVLTATITTLSSILVITICLFITYYSKDNVELLKNTLDLAVSTYNSSVVNLVFIMLITFFIQFLYIILIGFSGAVLGYNKNNLKIVRTIIYSFCLYILTALLLLLVIYVIGSINPVVMNIFKSSDLISIDCIKQTLYVAITFYIIMSLVISYVGSLIFQKGVNID